MQIKKKFESKKQAMSKMQRARRNGFDSFVRGAVCTIIIDCISSDTVSFIAEGWKVIS